MRPVLPIVVAVLILVTVGLGGRPALAAQPSTWNFQQTSVPAAQPLGNYGKGTLVAVVDTWVDPTQPQFGGRVVDEADCLSGSCQDRTYAPDTCVHGTHVAGIIASADYGVAPAADILAVQVLSGPAGSQNNPDAECSGTDTSVAAGITFAVAKGAKVINLSLADEVPGLFQSSAIASAVRAAADAGVLVVFAAGNDGLPITDDYGSSALLVAASGPSGQLASYTNYDSPVTGDVDVAAPGGDTGQATECTDADCVLSTFPHDATGLLEGTSMAAPAVSGLAALLLAQDPSRGLANLVATIEHTTTPLAGAGSGLIDDRAALEVEAASHPPTVTTTTVAGAPSGTTPTTTAGGGAAASHGTATTTPAGVGSQVTDGSPPGVSGAPPSMAGVPAPTTTLHSSSGSVGGPYTVAPAALAPRRLVAGRPTKAWTSRHLAVLVLACVLLGAVILAGLWMRESRRLFSRR